MRKKQLIQVLEWLIALAVCAYLAWRLATYDDYASLLAALRAMAWPQYTALVFALLLMPVNMAMEAWKWKSLMGLSFGNAQRQIYYGKLAGLITPWRVGEYPARGMMMIKEQAAQSEGLMAKVLSMGAVSGATMSTVIVVFGLFSLIGVHSERLAVNANYPLLVVGVLGVLALVLAFAPQLLRRWAVLSRRTVLLCLTISVLRLICWCVQLGLVIWALDPVVIPEYRYSVIPLFFLYYLFITVTPNVPIAEVGVRGAWAIVVFGSMNAALAGVLLWVINTLFPCLIWPFLEKNKQKLA